MRLLAAPSHKINLPWDHQGDLIFFFLLLVCCGLFLCLFQSPFFTHWAYCCSPGLPAQLLPVILSLLLTYLFFNAVYLL